MSDTPETDKAEDRDPMMYDDWAWIVPANFARQLERERDEARRERDSALKERDAVWNSWSKALDEAREELTRVRKELVASNRGAEKNSKVNQGLCAKLAEAERERDEARRDRDETMEELALMQKKLASLIRRWKGRKKEYLNAVTLALEKGDKSASCRYHGESIGTHWAIEDLELILKRKEEAK